MADNAYRPTTLTAIHLYNLRNQGWPVIASVTQNEQASTAPLDKEPIQWTKDKIGVYPSNADLFYAAKSSAANDTRSLNSYNAWTLKKNVFGNTPAAKGHFIINAFDRNRQTVSGVNGIYDSARDKESARPIAVAFYAGRIWYLMPDADVYYSQILSDDLSKVGRCYQEQDPTAEDINDVLDTDGGKIEITGATSGLKLIPIRSELLVIGDNGVWSISGGPQDPFSANTQSLDKITSIGAVSRDSVVNAEGEVFYWSEDGIYRLTVDPQSGLLISQSLTFFTIQTFYDDIPGLGKRNSRGYYDKYGKRVYWLYNDDGSYDGTNWKNQYNRALVYDLITGAFYTHTYDTTNAYVSSFTTKSIGARNTDVLNVLDSSSNTVIDSSSDTVVSNDPNSGPDFTAPELKMLTWEETSTDVWQYTFSEFVDRTFVDFYTVDSTGVNFDSYLETGDDVVGSLIANKEANTVYVFFKSTETGFVGDPSNLVFDYPSGCKLRGKWHWTNSNNSGRWSPSKEIYRLDLYIPSGTEDTFDFGFEVVQVVEQIRGSGRGLRLRFDSDDGKDFWILGWAIPYTAATAA